MRVQLFTKFEDFWCAQNEIPTKTILNFKRAWGAHFLSNNHQTWQICYFFVDLQIILLPLLEFLNCLKVEKNAGAFISRFSELLDQTKMA